MKNGSKIIHSQQNSLQVNLNILIIDDDFNFSSALEYRLRKSYNGINIIKAPSGEIGLNKIKDNGFHIVLLDLVMPGMDGAEVLENIRKLKKNYIIIILTAYANDDLRKRVEKENPNGIFDKCEFRLEQLEPYIELFKKAS